MSVRMWWYTAALCAIVTGVLPESHLPVAVAAPATARRFVIVPEESQVAYRVGETLIREDNRFNVAVGITRAVRGEIVIDRANPRASQVGSITVDISQFQSDSQRRDSAIRERWLESARFPIAQFAPTRIEGLPAQYEEGREIAVRIMGNLKVRGVVKPVTFTTALKLQGPQLTGTAATKVLMTDFGFDPPSIFGILRAQNEVEIEFRFLARSAP
ncbi:MAG TPA: YceI family protein [bacterium]|nr:YceI family protein [bacterium]